MMQTFASVYSAKAQRQGWHFRKQSKGCADVSGRQQDLCTKHRLRSDAHDRQQKDISRHVTGPTRVREIVLIFAMKTKGPLSSLRNNDRRPQFCGRPQALPSFGAHDMDSDIHDVNDVSCILRISDRNSRGLLYRRPENWVFHVCDSDYSFMAGK
jgi:hypothetical protein